MFPLLIVDRQCRSVGRSSQVKPLRTTEVELLVLKGSDMKNEHTNGLQFWPRQPVKVRHGRLWPAVAICAGMTFAAGNVVAQLAPNQTNGFGNHGLVTFTYLQNFGCLDEPTMGPGLQRDQGAVRSE
jgi:hypothetical protein